MSKERAALLSRGLIGTGAVVALALLVAFYAVVSGATSRAAARQAGWSAADEQTR